jgi:hypothetical protein
VSAWHGFGRLARRFSAVRLKSPKDNRSRRGWHRGCLVRYRTIHEPVFWARRAVKWVFQKRSGSGRSNVSWTTFDTTFLFASVRTAFSNHFGSAWTAVRAAFWPPQPPRPGRCDYWQKSAFAFIINYAILNGGGQSHDDLPRQHERSLFNSALPAALAHIQG